MITIIKVGKHVAICKECNTKFSFEKDDILRERTGPGEEDVYIECPVCGERIKEDDWEV